MGTSTNPEGPEIEDILVVTLHDLRMLILTRG